MRKLFLVLTAVVALTAASKIMVVWAQDAAPEAMTDTVSNTVTNDMNAVSNEVMGNEAMSNEVMGNEAAGKDAAGADSTY